MRQFKKMMFLLGTLACLVTTSKAQVFQDDFNSFSSSNWTQFTSANAYGRTMFNGQTQIQIESGVTFARLPLDTYNSFDTSKVKGTEITSVAGFGITGSGATYTSTYGWEWEARLRVPPTTGGSNDGLVFAFWTYKNHGGSSDANNTAYSADEIDYELLGNWPTNAFNLANFTDFNKVAPPTGHNDDAHHWASRASTNVTSFDWTTWQTFKIRWLKIDSSTYQVEWQVKDGNGVFQNVFTSRQAAPQRWMNIKFNIWCPNTDFGAAFNS